jgi:predicted MPP superfamily phosphohydrolase
LVFLGDYVDRGPDSRGVIELLRRLPEQTAGAVVCLRGNHEDALAEARSIDRDPSFLLPVGNGVAASYRVVPRSSPDVDPLDRRSRRAVLRSGAVAAARRW